MLRFVLLCLCLILPHAATAGAWLRDEGSTFASTTVELGWPQDPSTWVSMAPTSRYTTFYLEYGLTSRLTVGLDMGHAVSGAVKSVVFLRLPIRQRDSGVQVALDLGAGRIDGHAVLRPGLSLGLGHPRGWMSADMLAEVPIDGTAVDLKLDLTFGLNLPGGRAALLQVQTGQKLGDAAFVRLAPSVVMPLRDGLKGEIGARYGLDGDSSMGIKLGLWAEF